MRTALIPYLVLLAGLVGTAAVTWYLVEAAKLADRLRFDNLALELESRFRAKMGRHITALLGGAGLFAVDEQVSASEFRAYVDRLASLGGLQGVQGIGFSRRVPAATKRAFEQLVGEQAHEAFHIWPEGHRAEYHAILYLEPLDSRNRAAIGFDMATDPVRREAIERARDTGQPAASGKVDLVQDRSEPQSRKGGFLVYVPVYRGLDVPSTVAERRARLLGYVYSPFRSDDLLAGLTEPHEASLVSYALYDGRQVEPDRLLYQSGERSARPRQMVARMVRVAGHEFTLLSSSLSAFEGESDHESVVVTSLLGVVVTILLFTFVRFQTAARRQAEESALRLREAQEVALRHLQARDSFLSIASHELRTPLTALQLHVEGLLRNLERGTGGPATSTATGAAERERLTRRLDSVARQARRLGALINEMLDVSRINAGRLALHVEEVDLRELAKEVISRFDPELARAGCPLELIAPRPVLGTWDRLRLDQVLTNLLSNAIKYGPGRPIELTIEQDDTGASIGVTDHGMGIDPKDHARIFERFERAVSDRKFGGLGIGLWISREIVLSMGGRIDVTSRLGEGATFEVRLPMRPTADGIPVLN